MITALDIPITSNIVVLDENKLLDKNKHPAKRYCYAAIKIVSKEDTSEDYDFSFVLNLYQVICITSSNEYSKMLDYISIRNPIIIAVNGHILNNLSKRS